MSGRQRVDGQRAFILHSYSFSETSLVLDVFSRDHGRIPLLARGARRPRSALRGLLLAFQPLELAWFGGGEVRTLAKAEWVGGIRFLEGTALMLGYYLNELLLKLLAREDAHASLWDAYFAALAAISNGVADGNWQVAQLRRFEQTLLAELGYGLLLEREASSDEPVLPDLTYRYLIEKGPVRTDRDANGERPQGQTIRGKTLLDLARHEYSDPRTLAESKLLMRMLINHHLGGQSLQSRRVFLELQEI